MNHGKLGRSRNKHYKTIIPVYPCVTRKMTEEERREVEYMAKSGKSSNNHANQCNPNNSNYKGGNATHSAAQNNNHANQCNPNNAATKTGNK